MPHILLRFMGIEDENKLKTSRRIASVWVVISMFVAIFIGIIGSAMTKAGALALFENSAQSETLIVRTAVLLSITVFYPLSCWTYSCRNPCKYHVNFGFTAFGCILMCFTKPVL